MGRMGEARDFPVEAGTPTKPEEPAWGIPARARIFCGMGGVVFPFLCFVAGHKEPLERPGWQS